MAACNVDTLLTDACTNGFGSLSDRDLKIAILQLLCDGGGGGGGGSTEVYFVAGDPNGVQTATRPAIAYSATGGLWLKTNAGTNNTGWFEHTVP